MSDTIETTSGGWQADDSPAGVETTTPPSPALMPQQRPQAQAPDDDRGDDADDFTDLHAARKIRSENRSLRLRMRDAETERDGLRSVVDNLRRSEVERLAAAELHDARDLLDRHELDDFLDEGGHVDPARVRAAAGALIGERPHLAAPPVVTKPPTDRPIEGLIPGGSPVRKPESTTWYSAMRPIISG